MMPDPIQPDPRITIPPPEPKSRLKAPTILIAISAALIILGIGLCSAGGFMLEGDSTHPAVVGFGTICFWGGVLTFPFCVLWFFLSLFSGPRKERKS